MKKFILSILTVLIIFCISYSYPNGGQIPLYNFNGYHVGTDASADHAADTIQDTVYVSLGSYAEMFFNKAGLNLLSAPTQAYFEGEVHDSTSDSLQWFRMTIQTRYAYRPLNESYQAAQLMTVDSFGTVDSLYSDTLTDVFKAFLEQTDKLQVIYEYVMKIDSFKIDTYGVDSQRLKINTYIWAVGE